MKSKGIFHSPTKGKMELEGVVTEIANFINQDSESKYRLIVGTDSEASAETDFVTAIIVLRVGQGGRYFWRKISGGRTFHTLRDRIYEEVTFSLQTAQEMLGLLLQLKEELSYDFQIHIDVGHNGPTREVIKEVVGMVRGSGFEARIKPESFAASCVADKYA